MSRFASSIVMLALLVVTLGLCRQYLASMGVPVKWLSVRKMLRLIVRLVGMFVGLTRVVISLIRRRRHAHPLPQYTTIRLSQPPHERP